MQTSALEVAMSGFHVFESNGIDDDERHCGRDVDRQPGRDVVLDSDRDHEWGPVHDQGDSRRHSGVDLGPDRRSDLLHRVVANGSGGAAASSAPLPYLARK